jgi:hypothetical protein
MIDLEVEYRKQKHREFALAVLGSITLAVGLYYWLTLVV